MKNLINKALVLTASLGTMAFSLPSHALVRVVDECQTQNGAYRVMIADNQGIGLNRTSSFYATITNDLGETIGTYSLIQKAGMMSVSFGRVQYVDTQTTGKNFDFALPSTNFHNTILHAVLKDGNVIDDDNMKCRNF